MTALLHDSHQVTQTGDGEQETRYSCIRITDDDIARDEEAPVGRRQQPRSPHAMAFTAGTNVVADDVSAICRDRAGGRRPHLLPDMK